MVALYILVAVLLLGIEAFTVAFFAVFVAVGMLAAALLAGLGSPVWAQLAAASIVSVAGVVLVRPPLARALTRSHTAVRLPGVQDLVGQAALTVDEVGDEHHPGHALLAGERWLAVSENGLTLAPQSPVTVAAVRGTTLVVRPLAAVRPG
ncbi:MAG TPA: NfeD family protein [Candidatus Dormibacteraeota bacterium]|nr:NfeD family protein [Candidatus Dormibacteraeota bacterium]